MRRSRLVALSLLLVLGAAPPAPVAAQDQETVVTFVGPVGASPDQAFLVEVDDLRWQVGPLARSGLVRFPLDAIATVRIRRLDDCSIAATFTVAPGSHSVVMRDASRTRLRAGDVPGAILIGDASSPPIAGCVRQPVVVPSPAPEVESCVRRGVDIDLDAVPRPWMDALWRFYATAVPAFEGLATDAAMAQVRALDWRFRAVEAGAELFAEEAAAVQVGLVEGCAPQVDGARTDVRLGVAIDVAPGSYVVDAGSGRVLEQQAGRQRRVVEWTFEQATADAPWILIAADRPADLEPELPQATVGDPCPWSRGGRGAGVAGGRGDPFLARPWCDVAGDGRVVPWAEAIFVRRGLCEAGDAPHWLWLAESPGTPMDQVSDDPRPFVRDPDGVMGKAWAEGFARDARLPRDAVSTGITNGRVTIWTSASAGHDAVFLELRDGRIERWPRAPHEIACG